jgi:hydroxyacylglutathione hydrolase
MTFDIITIPCRTDNYAFLVANRATGEALLVDAPEAAPINAVLAQTGWRLNAVLLTHHHGDHVEGLQGLDRNAATIVIGHAADAHRLPPLDRLVAPGDVLDLCGLTVQVMAADGHTLNHVAYWAADTKMLFTGDSLMTHGCGRLFEGTPAQMLGTIAAFGQLPDETVIYSGHDYAAANLSFAAQFAPDKDTLRKRQIDLDKLSSAEQSTTGVTLALEKKLNPYLRVHLPDVKESVGLAGAPELDVFAEIRSRKDRF